MLERDKKWLELESGDRPLIEDSRPSQIFQVIARYKFARKFCKDRYVLDVGCGTGFGTVLLSDISRKVIGIDISEQNITEAKKLALENSVDQTSKFILGDILEVESAITEKDFDFIFCIGNTLAGVFSKQCE